MNSFNTSIIFTTLLILNIQQYSHASSSTIGTQNTFGASLRGQSTNSDKNTHLEATKKQELKNQKIQDSSQTETKLQAHHPLKEALIQYYKNLILDLINKNHLKVEVLESAIKTEDLFFESFYDLATNIKTSAHLNALKEIKKKTEINFIESELKELILIFLKREKNKLSETSEIEETVSLDTESILMPKKIQSFKLDREDASIQYHYANLKNGDFITSISQVDSKEVIIYNLTQNTTYTIDLEEIVSQEFSITSSFFESEFEFQEHRVYKNSNGKLISAIRSTEGDFYLVDILKQKIYGKLNNNFYITGNFYPNVIELETGEKSILIETEAGLKLLSIDTGNLIYFSRNKKFLGIPYKYKTTDLLNWDEKIKELYKIFQTLHNGNKILVLVFKHETVFIDVNTGTEILKRIPRGIKSNIDIELITIQNKNYIKFFDLENTLTLINIETGASEPFQYKFNELLDNQTNAELPFTIELNADQNKFIFLDKNSQKHYFPPIDISLHTFELDEEGNPHSYLNVIYNPSTIKNKNGETIILIHFAFKTFFIHSKTGKLLHIENYQDHLISTDIHTIKTIRDSFFYSKTKDPVLVSISGNILKFTSVINGVENYSPIAFDNPIENIEIFYDPQHKSYFAFVKTQLETTLIHLEFSNPLQTRSP